MSAGGGGGGGCGQFVIKTPFAVTPNQSIAITVGTGNTVIGTLLTLLQGNTESNGSGTSAASGGQSRNLLFVGGGGGGGGSITSQNAGQGSNGGPGIAIIEW